MELALKLKNGDIKNWQKTFSVLDKFSVNFVEFSYSQYSEGKTIHEDIPESFKDALGRYFKRSQGRICALSCQNPTRVGVENISEIDNPFFCECVKFKQIIEFASRFGIRHIIPQSDWWTNSEKETTRQQLESFFYDISMFAGKHKVRVAVPSTLLKAKEPDEIRSFFINRKVRSVGWCFEPKILQENNIDPIEAIEKAGDFLFHVRFPATSIIEKQFDVGLVLKSLSKYYDGFLSIQADNIDDYLESQKRIFDIFPDFENLKSSIDYSRTSFPGAVAFPSDISKGTVEIQPSDNGHVNTYDTRKLRFTVGKDGIKKGGRIAVRATHDCDMQFQTSNPTGDDYVSFKIISNQTNDACLEISARLFTDWTAGVELKVLQGELSDGDQIDIIFGDTSHGSKGIKLQTYEDSFRFYVLVDYNGDGLSVELPECNSFDITGGKPTKIRLICPAVVRPGEKFDILVRAEDDYFNIATKGFDSLKLSGKGFECLPDFFIWPDNERAIGKINDVSCSREGIFYIEAYDKGSGIYGLSTPVKCCSKSKKIYWGDLHSHSSLMDGTGSPDQNFIYARDVAGLDFFSLAEHCDIDSAIGTEISSSQQWEIIKKATKKYNNPDVFVTLLGYEIAQEEGDYNLYFRTDHADWYIPSTTPWELFRWLRVNRYKSMAIPHMTTYPVPTRGYDWNYYDSEFIRLVEIHSVHGTNDQWGGSKPLRSSQPGGFVQEALSRGYKLGLIGSSDGHQGRPGNTRGRNWYVNGLVAVYADQLTREDVFDSMYNRNCYASTNARILLEFYINQVPMGQECWIWERDRFKHISWTIAGTDEIDKIEILKNHHILYSLNCHELLSKGEFIDQSPTDHEDYYILRVTQKDGNMAWSSPVWVNAGDKTR